MSKLWMMWAIAGLVLTIGGTHTKKDDDAGDGAGAKSCPSPSPTSRLKPCESATGEKGFCKPTAMACTYHKGRIIGECENSRVCCVGRKPIFGPKRERRFKMPKPIEITPEESIETSHESLWTAQEPVETAQGPVGIVPEPDETFQEPIVSIPEPLGTPQDDIESTQEPAGTERTVQDFITRIQKPIEGNEITKEVAVHHRERRSERIKCVEYIRGKELVGKCYGFALDRYIDECYDDGGFYGGKKYTDCICCIKPEIGEWDPVLSPAFRDIKFKESDYCSITDTKGILAHGVRTPHKIACDFIGNWDQTSQVIGYDESKGDVCCALKQTIPTGFQPRPYPNTGFKILNEDITESNAKQKLCFHADFNMFGYVLAEGVNTCIIYKKHIGAPIKKWEVQFPRFNKTYTCCADPYHVVVTGAITTPRPTTPWTTTTRTTTTITTTERPTTTTTTSTERPTTTTTTTTKRPTTVNPHVETEGIYFGEKVRECKKTSLKGHTRVGGCVESHQYCKDKGGFWGGTEVHRDSFNSFSCNCCFQILWGTEAFNPPIPWFHKTDVCQIKDGNKVATGGCMANAHLCTTIGKGLYIGYVFETDCYCCANPRNVQTGFNVIQHQTGPQTIGLFGGQYRIDSSYPKVCMDSRSHTYGICKNNRDDCDRSKGIVMYDQKDCTCCADLDYVWLHGKERPDKLIVLPKPVNPNPTTKRPTTTTTTKRPTTTTTTKRPTTTTTVTTTTLRPIPPGAVTCDESDNIKLSTCSRIFGRKGLVYQQCKLEFVNVPNVCGIALTIRSALDKECDNHMEGLYLVKQDLPEEPIRIHLCNGSYTTGSTATLTHPHNVKFWLMVGGSFHFDVVAEFVCCDGRTGDDCCTNAHIVPTTTTTQRPTTTTTQPPTTTERLITFKPTPPVPTGPFGCDKSGTIRISTCSKIQVNKGIHNKYCRFEFVDIPNVCGVYLYIISSVTMSCKEGTGNRLDFVKRAYPAKEQRIEFCKGVFNAGSYSRLTHAHNNNVYFWLEYAGTFGFAVEAEFICCDGKKGQECCANANVLPTTSTTKRPTTTTIVTTTTFEPIPPGAVTCGESDNIKLSTCSRIVGRKGSSYQQCKLEFVNVPNVCGIALTIRSPLDKDCDNHMEGLYLVKQDLPEEPIRIHLCNGSYTTGSTATLTHPHNVKFWLMVGGSFHFDVVAEFVCCDGRTGDDCCKNAHIVPTTTTTQPPTTTERLTTFKPTPPVPTGPFGCDKIGTIRISTCSKIQVNKGIHNKYCRFEFVDIPNVCGVYLYIISSVTMNCKEGTGNRLDFVKRAYPAKEQRIQFCKGVFNAGSYSRLTHAHNNNVYFWLEYAGNFGFTVEAEFICCDGKKGQECCANANVLPTTSTTKRPTTTTIVTTTTFEPIPPGAVTCDESDNIKLSTCSRIVGRKGSSYQQCKLEFVNVPNVCGIALTLRSALDKECDNHMEGLYLVKQDLPEEPIRIHLCNGSYTTGSTATLTHPHNVKFWLMVGGSFHFDVVAEFVCCDGRTGDDCCTNAHIVPTTTERPTTKLITTTRPEPTPEPRRHDCEDKSRIQVRNCTRLFGTKDSMVEECLYILYFKSDYSCGLQITVLSEPICGEEGELFLAGTQTAEAIEMCGSELVYIIEPKDLDPNTGALRIYVYGYVSYDFLVEFTCCNDPSKKCCLP